MHLASQNLFIATPHHKHRMEKPSNLEIVTLVLTESVGSLTATPGALKSYTFCGQVSMIWEELGYRKRGVFLRPSRSLGGATLKCSQIWII